MCSEWFHNNNPTYNTQHQLNYGLDKAFSRDFLSHTNLLEELSRFSIWSILLCDFRLKPFGFVFFVSRSLNMKFIRIVNFEFCLPTLVDLYARRQLIMTCNTYISGYLLNYACFQWSTICTFDFGKLEEQKAAKQIIWRKFVNFLNLISAWLA